MVHITAFEAQILSYPKTIVPVPHPVTSLLRAKTVQKELGLLESEINEADKIVSEFELPLWRLRDLPLDQRNGAAAPLINQLHRKLRRLFLTGIWVI